MNPWAHKGYEFLTNGALNIYAVRAHPYKPNTFNDSFFISWREKPESDLDSGFRRVEFPATTMPGAHWLSNLMNPKGTAILKAGQYRNAYRLGTHRGKDALVQCRPVTVYRDKNRDDNFDLGDEETGMFGINIHRAGIASQFVNSWSAGCQVLKRAADFETLLFLCYSKATLSNGSFNYTLFEEGEL